MAVATSFEVLMPRPTWPSESPITTMALKRVRWPARVCFWTGLIYSPIVLACFLSVTIGHNLCCVRLLNVGSGSSSSGLRRGVPYLHDFILQLWQEPIDDLVFLDGQGVQIDFFHAFYLARFDQTTQFSDGLPFLLFALLSSAAGTSTSASSTAVTSTIPTGTESTARCCSSSIGHVGLS